MALHLLAFGFISTILLCSTMASSLSDSQPPTNTTLQIKYVTQDKNFPCGTGDQLPCLTIAEYANEANTFFVNDSTFIFNPGDHILTITLNLAGIHNISLKGLPDQSANIIVFNRSAGLMWKSSKNIEISNLIFKVESNFIYILSFELTSSVRLSNITILGNGHSGCSSIICQKSRVDVSNSKFVGLTGYSGAALIALESAITLAGNNYFLKNNASSGGAISLYNSTVFFNGYNSFTSNSARYFNKVRQCRLVLRVNIAFGSGGAISCDNSTLSNGRGHYSIPYKSNITNGTLSASESDCRSFCTFSAENYSNSNSADIQSMQSCSRSNNSSNIMMFRDNSALFFGGALFVKKSVISFNVYYYGSISCRKCVILEYNYADFLGGAIALTESSMQLCGNVSLEKNKAFVGGAIYTEMSNISQGIKCCSAYNLNVAQLRKHFIYFCLNNASYQGGAIASRNSSFHFKGGVLMYSNTADYGGAMILDRTSKVILKPSLNLHFVRNNAEKKGGAIYYHDSVSSCDCSQNSDGISQCFIPVSFKSPIENISMLFDSNSASLGGSVLYVGKLGKCDIYSQTQSDKSNCKNSVRDLIEALINVSKVIPDNNQIESVLFADAKSISFCGYEHYRFHSVYPGQKFNVLLAASGPAGINVNTTISHKIFSSHGESIVLRQVQRRFPVMVNTICTNVTYFLTAIDIKTKVTMQYKLYHDNPCDSRVDGVDLIINVNPCPLGFQLLTEHQQCKCDERLQGLTDKCDINTLFIKRKENTFWISKQGNDSGLILHKGGCPFDFCKDKLVNVSLRHPEEQCDFNRNGTLCGQCKENYSLALGTLHCLKCTDSSFIALIVPFALAGLVLVIVILVLHLTVDVGTLNGLILYVNIVHSNRQAFLPYNERESTNFLEVFIAWLNLDFGIESCFYDGMDIYTYSWLQFLFPFYIWFLIGAIIIIFRYSTRLSKSLGQNPVAALVTLIFVSYGKILNAIITPLSLTHLTFAPKFRDRSSSTKSVWLYDGSIEYFKDPKHIVLVLFAILTLLAVFVPYTFVLLCGHWLMAYSNKCFLSWLNRIKPFMDVYYAPFKQEARYWIGLTLLSRLALLLTISINAVGSNSVNILVIASVTAGLLFIKGRVYENKHNDFLESSFIFNLCVFSIATFYVKEGSQQSQYAVSSVSIVIAFLTFIGILFFHIFRQLKSAHVCRDFVISSINIYWLLSIAKRFPTRSSNDVELNNNDLLAVTSSFVELREPLIDTDDA